MAKRWEVAANTLPPDHPAWEAEAACLASACASFACTLSPQRIILGGGVMDSPGLLGQVQEKTRALLNGYLQHPLITDRVQEYITAPGLGSHAGICGALALGMEAAKREV
jgi:fructokinase